MMKWPVYFFVSACLLPLFSFAQPSSDDEDDILPHAPSQARPRTPFPTRNTPLSTLPRAEDAPSRPLQLNLLTGEGPGQALSPSRPAAPSLRRNRNAAYQPSGAVPAGEEPSHIGTSALPSVANDSLEDEFLEVFHSTSHLAKGEDVSSHTQHRTRRMHPPSLPALHSPANRPAGQVGPGTTTGTSVVGHTVGGNTAPRATPVDTTNRTVLPTATRQAPPPVETRADDARAQPTQLPQLRPAPSARYLLSVVNSFHGASSK